MTSIVSDRIGPNSEFKNELPLKLEFELDWPHDPQDAELEWQEEDFTKSIQHNYTNGEFPLLLLKVP